MKNKILILTIISIFFFVSCGKEVDKNPVVKWTAQLSDSTKLSLGFELLQNTQSTYSFDNTTNVQFRILDKSNGKITPVMICITNEDGKVHLPPDGKLLDTVSTTADYYAGVNFSQDKNWIGPIRKMNGKGNNEDRSYVYGLLPSIPYWQEPVMYMVSGDFTIELTEGKWRIAVDHGMEYKPVIEEFMVSGKKEPIEKIIELERWINLPEMGWYSGDIHVHHPTEEKLHQKFLIQSAKAVDLHVVNILEMGHHLGTEFKQAGFGNDFREYDEDYCLVSGQEDPRGKFGHIIGLNLQSMVRDTNTYDLYDITFRGIHEQKEALVGYAHFSWNGLGMNKGLPIFATTKELDFIELLQFSKMNTLGYYDYLNMGFKLTAAAGSDMPWGSNMGEVRTFVYTGDKFDVDKWFNGISRGNTFVSNGPVLFVDVDDSIPGTEISRKSGDVVVVNIKAFGDVSIGLPIRLQVISNNGIIKEVMEPDGKDELAISIKINIKESQWITAYVECNNGAIAHSTPVYIVVDGKPTWDKEKAPKLIQTQLDIIEGVGDDIEHEKHEHGYYHKNDKSVLERIKIAKTFYLNLLKEIEK